MLTRRVLVLALCAGLITAGVPRPAAAATLPTHDLDRFHVINDGQLFRMDFSDMLRGQAACLRGAGSFTVTLSRADFGRSPRTSRGGGPFSFGPDPLLDVAPLGVGAVDVYIASGMDPREAIAWEEEVAWTVDGHAAGLTSTFRVGEDSLSLTLPWELIEAAPGELVDRPIARIELNGASATVDAALVQKFRAAVALGTELPESEIPDSLRAIGASLQKMPAFVNGVVGFMATQEQAASYATLISAPPLGSVKSCWSPCLRCAGSLLTGLGAYAALIASCGGALVTGGATALACIASFLGVQGTHLIIFGSCGACVECAKDNPCPCEDSMFECECD